jgi:hypothetical protein
MKKISIIKPDKPWLDFSTLNLLMRCPCSYFWRVEQEIDISAPSPAILNGAAYHDCKAAYYNARKSGKLHDVAIVEAIKVLKESMKELKSDDSKYSLTNAAETMINYFDLWLTNEHSTIDVEVGFAIDIVDFAFIGKIDRTVDSFMGRGIEETKSTSIVGDRWQLRGKPNLQIDGYYAGYYISTGVLPKYAVLDIIPVVLEKDRNKRGRPFKLLTTRSESDLDMWLSNIREWWNTLCRYKDSGIYPKNTEMCVPLVGYSCNYHQLCDLFPNPYKMKDIEIPDKYKRELWQPFEFKDDVIDKATGEANY